MNFEPPEFFVDRALGKKLVEALRTKGEIVHAHEEHFAADAKDADWLQKVGEQGWIVLTKDKNIRRNAIERNSLINAGVGAFFLTSGNVTSELMASVFIKALPRMKKLIKKTERPFLAVVHLDSRIELLNR